MDLIIDKRRYGKDPDYDPQIQPDGTIKHYKHYYKDPQKYEDATKAFEYWHLYKDTGELRYLELCFEKLDRWIVKFSMPSIRKGYLEIKDDALQQARIDVWSSLKNTRKDFPSALHFMSYVKSTALFGVAYAKRFKFRSIGKTNLEDFEFDSIMSTRNKHMLNHDLLRLEAILQQRMKYLPKDISLSQVRKIEDLYGRYVYGFGTWT